MGTLYVEGGRYPPGAGVGREMRSCRGIQATSIENPIFDLREIVDNQDTSIENPTFWLQKSVDHEHFNIEQHLPNNYRSIEVDRLAS